MKKRDIADDILALLGDLTINGQLVQRHPRQLDRVQYIGLNKVLEALGGKWSRKANGHVFPDGTDVPSLFDAALTTGEYVDPRRDYDCFFTPPDLAAEMATNHAGIGKLPGCTVLEPSAGHGAIALAARACRGRVTCVELLPANVRVLEGHGFSPWCGDFLSVPVVDAFTMANPPSPLLAASFERVVMNPPFSGTQGIDHVLHAYEFLRPGGILVSVLGAGVRFRSDKKHATFRAFVERHRGTIEDLPDDSFAESGTNVRTVLVTVRRP